MYSLQDDVANIKAIGPAYSAKLKKLEIATVKDLVMHLPRYHKDTSEITPIKQIYEAANYTIAGIITKMKSSHLKGGRTIQVGKLMDEFGDSIDIMWFNQPYLADTLIVDTQAILSGNVKIKNGKATMSSPKYDLIRPGKENIHLGSIAPVYALTAGVQDKWLRTRMHFLFEDIKDSELGSPTDKYTQTALADSIKKYHFPPDYDQLAIARERLELEELAAIMLRVLVVKGETVSYQAPELKEQSMYKTFLQEFPFKLTADQENAVSDILHDISLNNPMHRLVQGDVGSGKTAIAAAAACVAIGSGYQVAFMAPTTILAEQHFHSLTQLFAKLNIKIELITGKQKTFATDADIYIGTSAVLARKESLFSKLGLIIVDEQHRFGVGQRAQLKEFMNQFTIQPHQLDLTATPIPRTLALTLFGELSVSTIKTKPAGRIPIQTRIVPAEKKQDCESWIATQIDAGRQIYWLCTLIEENEDLEVEGAKQTYEQLKTGQLGQYRLGLLHGKMSDKAKQEVMSEFKSGLIDLLVTTTVIEVGIDVPNATVMVIESADRLGLAQLHQLRGRVGRSDLQSWCFIFPSVGITENGAARLDYFANHNDGLELANFDLQLRGPGEVYGYRQSGIPDLKVAKLHNPQLIENARNVARLLYEQGTRSLPLF